MANVNRMSVAAAAVAVVAVAAVMSMASVGDAEAAVKARQQLARAPRSAAFDSSPVAEWLRIRVRSWEARAGRAQAAMRRMLPR